MNKFLYALIYIPAFLVALLPLRILYFISGFFYYFVYYIVRYRKRIVRKNLNNSFPEKTSAEILKIEKAFYRYLCDIFFETIKILHISDSEIHKRFTFKNIELIESYLQNRRPVVLMLAHYCNWEWFPSGSMLLDIGDDNVIGQVYRPLNNKTFDSFFLNLRQRFPTSNFTKHNVYRDIVNLKRANKNWIIGFMSDQKPSGNQVPYMMKFLNQETPVLTGTEKIAKHTGAAVCYVDISLVKRGYYEATFKVISDNPAETAENEITEKYMRCLEQSIISNPSAYLWTHNRWRIKTKAQ